MKTPPNCPRSLIIWSIEGLSYVDAINRTLNFTKRSSYICLAYYVLQSSKYFGEMSCASGNKETDATSTRKYLCVDSDGY